MAMMMRSGPALSSAVAHRVRHVVVKPPSIYVNHPSDFKPEPFRPRMEWPMPPKWMDETAAATLHARPTLIQGAQYIATIKSRRHERKAWVASVMSRESPPRKKN